MTTTKTTAKGIAATAAGVAVLLGGIGTFALWNVQGAIGTASTGTGSLTASFGDTTWEDVTSGAENPITDITAFRMVPGDVAEGTVPVTVTATGENLKVAATLDSESATLPAGVTASMALTNADGTTVTELQGSNEGTEYVLDATVALRFDESAEGSMSRPIDLSQVSVDLQQVLN